MNYYSNIDDLPIYNFYKIQETNDLRYLLKEFQKNELLEDEKNELQKVYNELIFQFDEINVEIEMINALVIFNKLMHDLTKEPQYKNQYLMFEKRLTMAIESKKENESNFNLSNEISILSKFLGFQIDKKTIPNVTRPPASMAFRPGPCSGA